MVRLILVVILLTLSLTFFLQNRSEEAVLHYFGAASKPTPIYKPILTAFGAGVFIMGLLLFPAWIKLRMELRRSRFCEFVPSLTVQICGGHPGGFDHL